MVDQGCAGFVKGLPATLVKAHAKVNVVEGDGEVLLIQPSNPPPLPLFSFSSFFLSNPPHPPPHTNTLIKKKKKKRNRSVIHVAF
jgi:hypothetical protein